jgi:hypothetical protein
MPDPADSRLEVPLEYGAGISSDVNTIGRIGVSGGRLMSCGRVSFQVRLGALVAAMIALLAGTAVAAPPEAGVLVPGESLGGVRLGWTLGQVEGAWGRRSGRCRTCSTETRYFNRIAGTPEGAGVTLRRGRVVAIFTLWAPRSWHTSRSLYVGEPERRVRATYGPARRIHCRGYDGLVLRAGGATRTVVYVVDGDVWGFGLALADEPVCR